MLLQIKVLHSQGLAGKLWAPKEANLCCQRYGVIPHTLVLTVV
jgi:hypothetical protein